eukprot:6178916-Pleurochrysis_carterae.AAC.2
MFCASSTVLNARKKSAQCKASCWVQSAQKHKDPAVLKRARRARERANDVACILHVPLESGQLRKLLNLFLEASGKKRLQACSHA